MKALVYDEYAVDDDYSRILKIKDVPEPVPKPNEVVFRVEAAALNYDDIWGMRGKPLAIPLPHISGTDAAGKVTAVGHDVKNFKIGDRVVSHGNMSCRACKSCTGGKEYNCKQRKVWGFETGGYLNLGPIMPSIIGRRTGTRRSAPLLKDSQNHLVM